MYTHHDGYRSRCLHGSADVDNAPGHDEIHVERHQLLRCFLQTLDTSTAIAVFQCDVLADDPASLTQATQEPLEVLRLRAIDWVQAQGTYPVDLWRGLGASVAWRDQRPQRQRAKERSPMEHRLI